MNKDEFLLFLENPWAVGRPTSLAARQVKASRYAHKADRGDYESFEWTSQDMPETPPDTGNLVDLDQLQHRTADAKAVKEAKQKEMGAAIGYYTEWEKKQKEKTDAVRESLSELTGKRNSLSAQLESKNQVFSAEEKERLQDELKVLDRQLFEQASPLHRKLEEEKLQDLGSAELENYYEYFHHKWTASHLENDFEDRTKLHAIAGIAAKEEMKEKSLQAPISGSAQISKLSEKAKNKEIGKLSTILSLLEQYPHIQKTVGRIGENPEAEALDPQIDQILSRVMEIENDSVPYLIDLDNLSIRKDELEEALKKDPENASLKKEFEDVEKRLNQLVEKTSENRLEIYKLQATSQKLEERREHLSYYKTFPNRKMINTGDFSVWEYSHESNILGYGEKKFKARKNAKETELQRPLTRTELQEIQLELHSEIRELGESSARYDCGMPSIARKRVNIEKKRRVLHRQLDVLHQLERAIYHWYSHHPISSLGQAHPFTTAVLHLLRQVQQEHQAKIKKLTEYSLPLWLPDADQLPSDQLSQLEKLWHDITWGRSAFRFGTQSGVFASEINAQLARLLSTPAGRELLLSFNEPQDFMKKDAGGKGTKYSAANGKTKYTGMFVPIGSSDPQKRTTVDDPYYRRGVTRYCNKSYPGAYGAYIAVPQGLQDTAISYPGKSKKGLLGHSPKTHAQALSPAFIELGRAIYMARFNQQNSESSTALSKATDKDKKSFFAFENRLREEHGLMPREEEDLPYNPEFGQIDFW